MSRKFDYQSVYDEATKSQRGQPGLSDKDRAVFDAFGTTNFEAVLGKLRDAITMAEVLERQPGPYRRRFRSVQEGLGSAVRRVHPEWDVVPYDTLAAIRDELRNYGVIFSTNYDLIVYWAIGCDDDYGRFRDCFWANGCEFDPNNCEVWGAGRPIFYMHGALHLLVAGSGVTRKLTQEDGRLLDQFGRPMDGDPEARPLLVSEASPRDKLQAIERNDYLAHAYDQLKAQDGPLLVFGHSLSDQDGHLVDAINAYPHRPVAVSMTRNGKRELRARQAEIWGKLHASPGDIHFFDAATHPLGDQGLCIDGGPLSRMRQRLGTS